MRNVVAYHLLSLDGVAESPDEWVFDHIDAEVYDHLRDLIASQDTVLLGRVTYQMWSPYWPTSTHEPFASFINNTEKYVASATLTEVTWQHSTLVKDDIVKAEQTSTGGMLLAYRPRPA